MPYPGSADLAASAATLALRLPVPLRPLAELAYNCWWSWTPGGADLFQSLDPDRWVRTGGNPVRLLREISVPRLHALATDRRTLAWLRELTIEFRADLARPFGPGFDGADRPLAFLCAEFGVLGSLPLYAGGLGVLAGDFLKEASDRAVPLVGIGLMYAQGTFHQHLDRTGWQHESWNELDTEHLPIALVSDGAGQPLTITVPIRERDVVAQIWRLDVGRIPLYLLDTNRPENTPADRWITGRLYTGDRESRLAQYALLGLGGVRVLRALGIDPALLHLNEGHAALAALDLLGQELIEGRTFDEALAATRERLVFTTHTPVAAGNDWFPPEVMRRTLDDLPQHIGVPWDAFLGLGRAHPEDQAEWFGVTPFALRTSRAANGVSRRHGQVARGMWHGLWPHRSVDDVPIGHITNGVHLPTWMAPAMQRLFDRHLRPDWRMTAADPATWAAVDDIPDAELWAARRELRAALVAYAIEQSVRDRLGREESTLYAEAALRSWNADTLTIGFARRIATYKRLYLLALNPSRSLGLLHGRYPFQLVIAGKAHPQDEEAKRSVQRVFAMNVLPKAGDQVVFLEDYDLRMAAPGAGLRPVGEPAPAAVRGERHQRHEVNAQRRPATERARRLVGGGVRRRQRLGAAGHRGLDPEAQDAHDAACLFDILEREVLPLFYQRDADGVPRGWVQRVLPSAPSARASPPRACWRTTALPPAAPRAPADAGRLPEPSARTAAPPCGAGDAALGRAATRCGAVITRGGQPRTAASFPCGVRLGLTARRIRPKSKYGPVRQPTV
ncbi:MAG: alpha-glucan family phosphorylase [Dehalococcoidia bacterium]